MCNKQIKIMYVHGNFGVSILYKKIQFSYSDVPNKNFPLVKLRTFSSLLGRGFTRLLFDEQTLNPNHMWKFIAHSHQQLFHNEKMLKIDF